jgi:hypothetical protein
MKTTSWAETRAARTDITPEQRANARAEQIAEVAAYNLAAIRRSLGLTQTDVAAAMAVGQRRVSAVESAQLAHTELGTIASYVRALGGTLRIVADFGDRTVLVEDSVSSVPE